MHEVIISIVHVFRRDIVAIEHLLIIGVLFFIEGVRIISADGSIFVDCCFYHNYYANFTIFCPTLYD